MDLEYTADQRSLRDAARSYLRGACPPSRVRETEASESGFDATLWSEIAAMGWPGLAGPEDYGGSGQGLLEVAIVCEELGRVAAATPLIPSLAGVLRPTDRYGDAAAKERWLAGVGGGSLIGSAALAEPGNRDELASPSTRVDNGKLAGAKTLVPYAAAADVLLVSAKDESGLTVVMVSMHDITTRRHHAIGGEPRFAVDLDGVPVDTVLARGDVAADLLRRLADETAVLMLADAVGSAERALELSLEHARVRHQFGRPIGAFQAVAHRCVDMRTDIDACRYLCYQAAWALDQSDSAHLEVAAAKAYGNEAMRRIFRNAHQVHGAIGFSSEHDLQLFTRRAKTFELSYGGAAQHHERIAAALGLTNP